MRILRLVIECVSPLHCGGGANDVLDQPVSRDAFGYWRIPGSSLAGALRSLGEKLDPRLCSRMFGEQDGSDSLASLVWCEDGLLLDYNGKTVLEQLLAGREPEIRPGLFLRDHVRIDLETGASEQGGKFDAEIVPAGTRFLLEFRCDGWDRPLSQAETDYFDRLCSLILSGELTIGGKSGLGYGLYRVIKHECRELNLNEPAGMQAWLALPPFGLPGPQTGQKISVGAATATAGAGLDGWLELPLACAGPILIGGGNPQRPDGASSEADIVFALTPRLNYEPGPHEYYEPVLPASSIRGVMRHAIHAIAGDLGIAERDKVIDRLFGFVDGENAQCGKLVFTDSALTCGAKKVNYQFEQHVALDRFSASALDGALFSEEPFWNAGAKVRIRIRACGLLAHEAALFFHAVFDLLEGAIAFGSGTRRGNGRLRLPLWKENPLKCLGELKGDLAWNGQPVLASLPALAQEWDAALKELK